MAYEVRRNQERERQRREAAERHLERAKAKATQLADQAASLSRRTGRTVTVPAVRDAPAGATTDDIAASAAEAEDQLRQAEEQIEAAENEVWAEHVASTLTHSGGGAPAKAQRLAPTAVPAPAPATAPTPATSATAPSDVGLAGELERILASCPAGMTAGERAGLESCVSDLADKVDHATLKTELRVRLKAITKAATQRARDAEQAIALARTLDGLDAPQLDETRRYLGRVANGEVALDPAEVARIEALRQHAEDDGDRQYVVSVLEGAFRDLGYDVGPAFGQDLLEGSTVATQTTEGAADGHAVLIEMHGTQVTTELVRTGGEPDASLDMAAQQRHCQAYNEISASVEPAGVGLRLVEHLPPSPGDLPHIPAAQSQTQTQAQTAAARRRASQAAKRRATQDRTRERRR